jgi:hypothetical protein
MKPKLVNNGIGKEEETENDIMSNAGYIKLFDCGNLRLIWRQNNG